ncbi:hypothetical protein FB451DRAFT_1519093 [Mycena latifolia]|nr:hypothetical protein FB451DRAFT_1519093 [Mycena latifolia]
MMPGPSLQYLSLCSELAAFLTHPELGAMECSDFSLPRLPALRAIKFYLDAGDSLTVWFPNTLARILAPTGSPLLAEITVTFYPIRDHQCPYLLDTDLMDTLYITLAAHPSPPRLRWRLDFHVDNGGQDFATFAEAVRRGMPKMQAEGRLALEAYVNPDSLFSVDTRQRPIPYRLDSTNLCNKNRPDCQQFCVSSGTKATSRNKEQKKSRGIAAAKRRRENEKRVKLDSEARYRMKRRRRRANCPRERDKQPTFTPLPSARRKNRNVRLSLAVHRRVNLVDQIQTVLASPLSANSPPGTRLCTKFPEYTAGGNERPGRTRMVRIRTSLPVGNQESEIGNRESVVGIPARHKSSGHLPILGRTRRQLVGHWHRQLRVEDEARADGKRGAALRCVPMWHCLLFSA